MLVVGAVTASPSQAVQKCSTTQYATWGAASFCKDGATMRAMTLDRVEDGYCVELWAGVKWSDGTPWGIVPVARNCANNTWQVVTTTISAADRPLYACAAFLYRGTAGTGYRWLPVWREFPGIPGGDNCPGPA
ncbi:MAG: hypothetical protein U0Q15_02205 [Kineosporiaceae bacterium]